ncbi:hypothetical protein [Streptomyces decoyicus]|uniref:hypothetical protein n=1 Tax=Streptomyces decoyicus TaxID=249567 RepID=UPI00386523D0|nr:hypothetical protein OG532_37310 [Streptomyces decoyicus]
MHTFIAPQQLHFYRLLRDSTADWLTPSRALEQDLPTSERDRYTATTTAARQHDVRTAACNSWRWNRGLGYDGA